LGRISADNDAPFSAAFVLTIENRSALKSTLAVLLARSQGVAWRFADLREFPAPVIRAILVGIASSFRQTGARGLILDDFPADADNALISMIGQVARAIADADGVLIITSGLSHWN
jgi:hypothetical protein